MVTILLSILLTLLCFLTLGVGYLVYLIATLKRYDIEDKEGQYEGWKSPLQQVFQEHIQGE